MPKIKVVLSGIVNGLVNCIGALILIPAVCIAALLAIYIGWHILAYIVAMFVRTVRNFAN